jgi:hypothetical protein
MSGQVPAWLLDIAQDELREGLCALRAYMLGIGEDPGDPVQWDRRKRQYCAESVRQAQLALVPRVTSSWAGVVQTPAAREGQS